MNLIGKYIFMITATAKNGVNDYKIEICGNSNFILDLYIEPTVYTLV